MSSIFAAYLLVLAMTITFDLTAASPLYQHSKRSTSTGARAGMGIGIAILALLVIGAAIYVAYKIRRRNHLTAMNKERAILAGEKNKDGSDKVDKYAPPTQNGINLQVPSATAKPEIKRNKSIRDRLMQPIYRNSTVIELPDRVDDRTKKEAEAQAHWDTEAGRPLTQKPWADESSPRPSFSSKRATRMMMFM